jgi:hypothetical protein
MKDHGAIKLFPAIKTSDVEFGDGDDDGGGSDLNRIEIMEASNGWIINSEFIDENGEFEGIVDVFNTNQNFDGDLEAIKTIIRLMGLEGKIKAIENK